MSADKNKKLVREFLEEVWNKKKVSEIGNFISLDIIYHYGSSDITDLSIIENFIKNFVAAFPDSKVDIEELMAERDIVAVRTTLTGTPKGDFSFIRTLNKSVIIKGVSFYRVNNGRIGEIWAVQDTASLMLQLKA